MPLRPDYTSTSALKALMGITDTVDDAAIGASVTAASRMVDAYCQRQFGSATGQVREYAITGQTVAIEDVTSVTEVAVRPEWGTELTVLTVGTQYLLEPRNASTRGTPFTRVRLADPYDGRMVLKVTGTVGWSSIPELVVEATKIQAIRLFKRPQSPFGVAGSPDVGSELRLLARLDPDVQVLLTSVRRNWGSV